MTIRRIPADFQVREVLTDEFRAQLRPETIAAGYALFELTKTSLTTPEAVQRVAKALGVRHAKVEYAGLKDKHACTVQHVTVARKVLPGPPPASLAGGGWTAAHLGWSAAPVAAAAIATNQFAIVVRDLTAHACAEMDRRARLLADPGAGGAAPALLILNYFGDQRFGSARHGKGFAAPHLVRGEFERALGLLVATPARKDSGHRRSFTRLAAAEWGRWQELAQKLPRCPERRAIEVLAAGRGFKEAFAALPHLTQTLCVEAYQSHLWNGTARRLADRMVAEATSRPIVTADDFGELRFPPVAAVGPEWRNVEIPVLAPESVLVGPWREEAAAALKAEGLTLDQLHIPGLRRPAFAQAFRPLFVRADQLAVSPPEADEFSRPGRLKRTVAFGLPRGAYATVVLRSLGQ